MNWRFPNLITKTRLCFAEASTETCRQLQIGIEKNDTTQYDECLQVITPNYKASCRMLPALVQESMLIMIRGLMSSIMQ